MNWNGRCRLIVESYQPMGVIRMAARILKMIVEVTKTPANSVSFINRHPLAWFNSGSKYIMDQTLSPMPVPKRY